MENIRNAQAKFRFSEIHYEALDTELSSNTNLVYKYHDTIIDSQIDNVEASFKIKRVVSFEPEALYSLNVLLEFIVEYDSIDDRYTTEEFKEQLIVVLHESSGFERLSSLIANISSAQGNTPIITNAHFTPEI